MDCLVGNVCCCFVAVPQAPQYRGDCVAQKTAKAVKGQKDKRSGSAQTKLRLWLSQYGHGLLTKCPRGALTAMTQRGEEMRTKRGEEEGRPLPFCGTD